MSDSTVPAPTASELEEVERIVAARPYHSLTDFWQRARVSRPIVERLVLAGGLVQTFLLVAVWPLRRFSVQFSSIPESTLFVDGRRIGSSIPAKSVELTSGLPNASRQRSRC